MKMQLKTSLTNSVRLLAVAGILSASASVHATVADLVCEMGTINYWDDGFVITDITVINDYYEDGTDSWLTLIDFDLESVEILKVWNAELSTDSDDQDSEIESSGHNAELAYGESTTFGMIGSYSGEWQDPVCNDDAYFYRSLNDDDDEPSHG